MKWARIENNIVVEITGDDPSGRFHPSILWDEISDEIVVGCVRDADGNWSTPEATTQPDAAQIVAPISPVEFKLLFTPAERVAIKAARATDPVIDDFFDIVDDPRLTQVDLGLASTSAAIHYLADQKLIEAARVDEILLGVVK